MVLLLRGEGHAHRSDGGEVESQKARSTASNLNFFRICIPRGCTINFSQDKEAGTLKALYV
jgi:hypothetical protein